MLAVLVVELVHEAVEVVVAVVSVVESVVVVVLSSVTPEDELEQIGQHFGSQPVSGQINTRRARKPQSLNWLFIDHNLYCVKSCFKLIEFIIKTPILCVIRFNFSKWW
jgi:hypothetical protein